MPSTHIYGKYIYQNNNLEEDLSRIGSFYYVLLPLTYSSLLLGLINIGLYHMENILFYLHDRSGRLGT